MHLQRLLTTPATAQRTAKRVPEMPGELGSGGAVAGQSAGRMRTHTPAYTHARIDAHTYTLTCTHTRSPQAARLASCATARAPRCGVALLCMLRAAHATPGPHVLPCVPPTWPQIKDEQENDLCKAFGTAIRRVALSLGRVASAWGLSHAQAACRARLRTHHCLQLSTIVLPQGGRCYALREAAPGRQRQLQLAGRVRPAPQHPLHVRLHPEV